MSFISRFLKQLFLIFILPCIAFANVHLFSWQTEINAPKIILPRLTDESKEHAVYRYLQNIKKNSDLSKINSEIEHFKIYKTEDLSIEKNAGKARLAIIANIFKDMTIYGERIQRNINTFTKTSAEPFVIAMSADIGLSETDAVDFRSEVSKNFSLLVSQGGDDISPELYGQEKTFALNTNITRDRSEFLLVQSFKKYARGIFFGICRGHQMGAIADGHKLFQDLSKTGAGSTDYHINLAGKNSAEMQTWHGIDIEKSLLSRFLKNQSSIRTNSVHHQGVDVNPAADSYVIAVDDEGRLPEALQSKNNKSLSVQFHPEFPAEYSGDIRFSENGFQIIKGIVSYARLIRQKNFMNSCSRLF
jgi:gamma-glutamyl-gamma-aminobutyrate hydrolase PuuD